MKPNILGTHTANAPTPFKIRPDLKKSQKKFYQTPPLPNLLKLVKVKATYKNRRGEMDFPEEQPLLFTTTYPARLWARMFGRTRDGILVRLIQHNVSSYYDELLWEFCGDLENRTLITTMTGRNLHKGDNLYDITEWEIVNPDETDTYFKVGNGVAVFEYSKDGVQIGLVGYGPHKEKVVDFVNYLRDKWSE